MNLRVLGCHGGNSLRHRGVSFLVDGELALDAGSIASPLDLDEQGAIRTALISHPHIDHVAELGQLCDGRAHAPRPSLGIAGTAATLGALREHLFNGILWPDFTAIEGPAGPVAHWVELREGAWTPLGAYRVRPVPVDHSIPAWGFVVQRGERCLVYTGDTGPTDRVWREAGKHGADAVLTEVSFPNRRVELALRSGHLTPDLLSEELRKLRAHSRATVWVYGLKPAFEAEILEELSGLDESVRVLRNDETVQVEPPADPAPKGRQAS